MMVMQVYKGCIKGVHRRVYLVEGSIEGGKVLAPCGGERVFRVAG